MSAGKTVWHLPFALLIFTFVLYATVGLWFNAWIAGGVRPQGANELGGILSPETIDALYGDERLHHALLSLTEAVAQTSSNLGEQYGFAGLKDFGTNLTGELVRLKAVEAPRTRRGLLEDMGNLITGGAGGNATMQKMLDALGLGGGAGGLSGALGLIGNEVVGGLATPALFLGIGLGVGAEAGLNLSDTKQSMSMATQVAAAFNEQPTGINLVAQNLGSGLSAQLVPQIANVSGESQIGMAAFALAQGVGEASASGLKLTNEQAQPTNASDIMGIARNFGLGIASPIVSKIDVQSLLSQTGGQNIMAQLPELALSAGRGLGEGARDGLGLKAQGPPPFRKRQQPSDQSISDAVGQFTRGLSQAFLTQADLSKIMVTGNASFDLNSMIVPLASGAGKGIGNGVALSFGFKQDMGLPEVTGGINDNKTAELVAQEFTQGLVSMFLTNSTAVGALVNLTMQQQGGLTANFKASKAAEGLARGIIEGSVNAMSSVGGIQNLLSGNFSMDAMMNLPTLAETKFDDSINGSAVSFARGLFGEGTILASNLIRQLNKPADPNAPPPFKQKRGLEVAEAGIVPYNPIAKRQDAPAQVPMVPLAIDSNTLQGIAQLSVDKLTCSGVGGLAAAALGLMNGAKMSMDMSKGVPLDNQTLAALPKGPISIMSEGNRFTILMRDGKITVNELELVPFAVLTGLHILLTTIAFFYALPAYVILGVIWRLSVMIGHPIDEAKSRKWRMIILVGIFLPTALLGIIFGMVGMGKAKHFRSAHDIFGLLTFIFLPPTVYVTYVRLRTDVPHPSSSSFAGIKQIPKIFKSDQKIYLISTILVQQVLAFGQFAWIQGWTELRSISLCIVDAVLTAPAVVGLVSILLFVQVTAMGLIGVRVTLEQRIAKREAKGIIAEKSAESGTRVVNRSDTMKSFGFDNQPEPFSPQPRPPLIERNTGQLLGREDSQIGWPSEVRKYGEDDADMNRDDPFLSPREQVERENRRTYDPKLGGYVQAEGPDYPNIFSDPIITADAEPKARKFAEDERNMQFRPSSELDPDARYQSSYYAPQSPDMPTREDESRMPIQRFESFSRPLGRGPQAAQNTRSDGRPSGEDIRQKYSDLIAGTGKRDGDEGGYGGLGRAP